MFVLYAPPVKITKKIIEKKTLKTFMKFCLNINLLKVFWKCGQVRFVKYIK